MEKDELIERLEFILKAYEEGWIIGTWTTEVGVYLASRKDKDMGVYLYEILALLRDQEKQHE